MTKHLNELNPKQFDIGQIVFFTNNIGNEWDWGVVDNIYSDGYAIALYELVDCRRVEGVPVAEYDFNKSYRKLPKGWNYDTDLVHLDFEHHKELRDIEFDFYDVDSIQNAIDKSVFVRPSSQDRTGYPEVEITKEGYRIVWKHDLYSSDSNKRSRPNYAIVNWRYVYSSYDEVKEVLSDYQAELNRLAEMSDYDWSIEQIDKVLNRSVFIAKEDKPKIKQWLIDNTNIEEVEIRCFDGYPEWKYEKNKKWKRLEANLL